MEGLTILTAMCAPAALIAACGLYLLGIYNKYSNIVDSLRALNSERRSLATSSADSADAHSIARKAEIVKEWPILRSRLSITLNQIRLIAGAAALFLIAALALGVSRFVGEIAESAAIVFVGLGIASMLTAMVFAVSDAEMIAGPIDLESPATSAEIASSGRSSQVA